MVPSAHDGRALSRAFVIRLSVLSFGCFPYAGSHFPATAHLGYPSPRPLSQPLESFSLEMDHGVVLLLQQQILRQGLVLGASLPPPRDAHPAGAYSGVTQRGVDRFGPATDTSGGSAAAITVDTAAMAGPASCSDALVTASTASHGGHGGHSWPGWPQRHD
jgi:hypothetical protein